MKIVVYAITKNEEKHVKRWYESMKEADEIYCLDTGSTDNTVLLLKELGVHVFEEEIIPWRFDTARNKSLDLVPLDTDICVCTDLDEVFIPGWRKHLENNWTENTTRASYNYNWSLTKNNEPIISFYINKIHSRKNYCWINPVHEVLKTNIKENMITIDEIILNHYPDSQKSRKSYLPLLELAVREDPSNDRNTHYLGREYMYYNKYNEAITTLKKHLSLPTATWKDERAASLRFISRCYKNLNNYPEAKDYLIKAINEAPYLRDAYVELAILEYELKRYEETIKYALKALEIKTHRKTYINEPFSWDNTIYELLAISYYYQTNYQLAIYFNNLAIDKEPNNERLINNHKIYKQKEA